MRVPGIEIRPCLAPYRQRVFKTFGRDKRDLRTFALEQRIRGDRRPVPDLRFCGPRQPYDSGDRLENGAPRIVGRRAKLQHLQASADTINAIGEGASGIDADDESCRHSLQPYQSGSEPELRPRHRAD